MPKPHPPTLKFSWIESTMWTDDSNPGECLLASHQSFSPAVPTDGGGTQRKKSQRSCKEPVQRKLYTRSRREEKIYFPGITLLSRRLLSRDKRRQGGFPERRALVWVLQDQ